MTGVYRSDAGREVLLAWCSERLLEWPVPHERTEIPTAAGPTHVVVSGQGGRTFLHLPGTHFNAATSSAFVRELSAHGRVVVPDLPGQPGLSAAERPGPDRMTAYGRWVDEVVAWTRDTGGLSELVLVGHSLGAAVALSATPDGVDRLVLVAPAGFVPARVSPAVLAVTLRWLARPSRRSAAALARRMAGPGSAPSPTLVEWLALVARHVHAAGAPGPLPPAVTGRWRDVPCVVVAGAHDCFFRREPLAARVAATLGADPVVLHDLGHLALDEDPRRLAALVAGDGSRAP